MKSKKKGIGLIVLVICIAVPLYRCSHRVKELKEQVKSYTVTTAAQTAAATTIAPETATTTTKPTETTTPGTKPTVQYCDVNCDGEITIMDVIAVNKQLLGIGNLSEPGKANADVDVSGTIDGEDSLNVLKRVIELLKDADFPIKKA